MVQFDCIEKRLRRVFYVYGRFIARHPIWFLVCPLLLTAALGSGVLNFYAEYDVEKLFSPEGARSKEERSTLQHLFPEHEKSDNFSVIRMSTLGQYGYVIVTSKEKEGNVLTEDVFNDVVQLDRDIRNITVDVNGMTYGYRDLCAGSCENATDTLIILHGVMNVNLNDLAYPVHMITRGPRNLIFFLGSTIGGVTTSADGDTEAKAWLLHYYLLSYENAEAVMKWQEKFLSVIAYKSYKHITMTRFTAHSLEDELKRNADAVFTLLPILLVVLIVFTAVSCMSADWVHSKPWLGPLGVFSAGLAIISGFGLVLHTGVPFIDIVASSPFLVLGIGVDDTFVMLAAWRQTDFRLSVEERMGKAFSEAALSITITTITDALSIGIGTVTNFRSVRIFCIFTVLAVLFDYFYQVTFFAACMVLTGHREANNQHPATCMKAVPKSLAGHRSAIFRHFCTGGYTEDEKEDTNKTAGVRAMTFFRDSWGGLLSTRPFKIFLLHVYLVYLGFAIWGCFNVKEGITFDRLAGDGSYVADYYDQDTKYFREYGHCINVVVGKELALWNPTERDKIEEMIQDFEESVYFHGKFVTSAWIRDFTTFIGNDAVDSRNFSIILDYFLSKYSLLGVDYKKDIMRESGKVKYSRFFVFSNKTDTSIRESNMMSIARAIADKNKDLNVTVYHPMFIIYDQYLAVWPNTRQNLIIATASMFLVSLFLLPHPVCSLWVTFSIVSICTGVIGYMTWWGVNLDSISMINIIICIGFSVDFSAHITYSFVSTEGDTGNQRMRNALHAIGYPIMQGALSTILGVSVLVFIPSYVYRTFFKTMFLVISLGAFHGLFIVPVLLSVTGPRKITKKRHSVSPINPTNFPSIEAGVNGHRDWDRMEPDHGFGASLQYRDDFHSKFPAVSHKMGCPLRYCSIQNNPRSRGRRVRTNPAPLPYANGSLPPLYEVSGHRNGWPGGNGYLPSLSGRSRQQDKYIEPHEYTPRANTFILPRYDNAGPRDHRPLVREVDTPKHRVGPPGREQMANGWSRY